MKTIVPTSLLILLLLPMSALAVRVPDSPREWARFTKELAEAGMPARFLTVLPAEFVQLEFVDLKTAAAEYHPAGHRMVFHLALSENHQGRRFRPVRDISNHELATMYHELFHAYFDYLDFAAGSARMPEDAARIRTEARAAVGVPVHGCGRGHRCRGRKPTNEKYPLNIGDFPKLKVGMH